MTVRRTAKRPRYVVRSKPPVRAGASIRRARWPRFKRAVVSSFDHAGAQEDRGSWMSIRLHPAVGLCGSVRTDSSGFWVRAFQNRKTRRILTALGLTVEGTDPFLRHRSRTFSS